VAFMALTLVGAGFGAVLRYVLGGWVNHRIGPEFPWGTLAVNVIGCFVLGFLKGVALQDGLLLLVVGKGLLAGFTTFSTLMFETLSLARARKHNRAFFNVVGSSALGIPRLLFGVYLGMVVGG
jgi:fluoride exporter